MSRLWEIEPHVRRWMQRSALEEAYVFSPGEAVSFYPVDPETKCGLPVRPGVVVEDAKRLTMTVRDPATGAVHRISPGQAWNEASRTHAKADDERVDALMLARYGYRR